MVILYIKIFFWFVLKQFYRYKKLFISYRFISSSWPSSDFDFKNYLNKGSVAQALSMGKNTPIQIVIEHLTPILERLGVRCIIKVELEVNDVFDALMASNIKHRVIFHIHFVNSPRFYDTMSNLYCVLGAFVVCEHCQLSFIYWFYR